MSRRLPDEQHGQRGDDEPAREEQPAPARQRVGDRQRRRDAAEGRNGVEYAQRPPRPLLVDRREQADGDGLVRARPDADQEHPADDAEELPRHGRLGTDRHREVGHREGDDQRERAERRHDGAGGDHPDRPPAVGDDARGELHQRVHRHQRGERQPGRGVGDAEGDLERVEQRREQVANELRHEPQQRGQNQRVVAREAAKLHRRGLPRPRAKSARMRRTPQIGGRSQQSGHRNPDCSSRPSRVTTRRTDVSAPHSPQRTVRAGT